jgi:hypothetical protein
MQVSTNLGALPKHLSSQLNGGCLRSRKEQLERQEIQLVILCNHPHM